MAPVKSTDDHTAAMLAMSNFKNNSKKEYLTNLAALLDIPLSQAEGWVYKTHKEAVEAVIQNAIDAGRLSADKVLKADKYLEPKPKASKKRGEAEVDAATRSSGRVSKRVKSEKEVLENIDVATESKADE